MSRGYADRWHDPAEPSWVAEPTAEWQPQFPGQRYPGDDGVDRQPRAARGRASAVGRAEVPPLAPTRPDGTYVGRSWDEEPDGRPGRQELPGPRRPDGPNGARPVDRSAAAEPRPEQARRDRRRSPQGDPDRRRDGVTWSDFGPQGAGSGPSPRHDPDRYADRRDQHDPDRYARREPDQRDPDRYARRDADRRDPGRREPDRREPDQYARREPDRRDPDQRDPDRYPRRDPDQRDRYARREPDRRDPDRYARREPDRREPDRREPDRREPDRREPDRREPDRREPDPYGQRPRRSEPTDRDQFRRGTPVSSTGRPDASWPEAGRVPEPGDDARRSAARRSVEGADRRPSTDSPQRSRYQWSSHPGQPAFDDGPVVDGYRTEFGVGDPDGAPYPDGYIDEPVRPTPAEGSRPDWSPERGRPEPSLDQQAKAAPARGDLPWPAPGPVRPSSGRDHREYQRPDAPEQGADRPWRDDRRSTGGPGTPGPERFVDRPAAQLPDTERPVSPAPDGPPRRHLSVVPDRPVSPTPEHDRPVSPAAGRARPVSPAPERHQPDEAAAHQGWSAAPGAARDRTDAPSPGPDRRATGRPDQGRTGLPGQHRDRPVAAAERGPAGDTVRPAPLHHEEVRPAPLQEHQVRPAPLHDQPVVATPPPVPAPSVAAAPPVAAPATSRPVPAPPSHRPVSAPPAATPATPGRDSGSAERPTRHLVDQAPVGPTPDRTSSEPDAPAARVAKKPTRYVPPPAEPVAPAPAQPTSEGAPGWFGAPAPVPADPPPPPETAASTPAGGDGALPTALDEPVSPAAGGAPPAAPRSVSTVDPEQATAPPAWAPSDAAPSAPAAAPVSGPPAATPSAPVSGPPVAAPPDSAAPADQDVIEPVSALPVSAPPLPGSAPPDETAPPETPVSGEPTDGEQAAEPADDAEPVPEAPADPEQVLANYRWQLDAATLREVVDDPEELRTARQRLTDKLATALDNRSRARLLSLRAVASRVLGDLDDALADGRMALTYAEATGELRRTALAQARLAHVLRWRGEFAEADRLFAEANSVELPDRLRAALHEHAARCCYDQGRLIEACHHFERALDLRGEGDAELLDRVRTGLDAIAAQAAETGFGPYPRSWDEVLERDRSPVPARDGGQGLWGYADAEGDMVVPARYAEAQPFRDGLAWVRGPQTDRWSLIDLAGETVIEPAYLAARPFSDGLAWVVRDESGWMAVDTAGEVAVPPGFAEVRPFRKGVATVRREGWGAVDRTGRIVVPTRYHGFHTTLADGRYIDGFTDEGLAVVDLAGRKGVVDRTGQVIVAPAHPALLIHPVAFLATNSAGNWGALDRRGAGLIDPMFQHPAAVVTEIEGLLTDANPVL